MSERQFDIFDDPFRNAAEQYEPEYNDAAWKKMEAKLDKEQRVRKPFYWLRWLTDGMMISLMVVIATQLMRSPSSSQKNNDSNRATNSTQQQVAATSSSITGGHKKTDALPGEFVKSEPSSAPVTAKEVAGKFSRSVADENTGKKEKTASPALSLAPVNEPLSLVQVNSADSKEASQKPSTKADENIVSGTSAGGKTGFDVNSNLQKEQLSEKAKSSEATDHISPQPESLNSAGSGEKSGEIQPQAAAAQKSGKAGAASSETLNAEKKSETTETAANQQKVTSPKSSIVKPKQLNFKGFYLHVALSPEYTYVAGNKAGPLTTAFGGGIGYAFNNRLSVQSGLYVTNKIYAAGPTDYKLNRVLPDSVVFTHVDAKCKVLEIPLQLNYNVLNSRKHHLIASVGFASLIMSKEAYDYGYAYTTGPGGYYRDHTFTTKKFEPFAAMLLSAGYAYSVNSKLSLVVAPYAKIPMHGVGEGSVKITSVGAMFGLQYNVLDTRRRASAKSKLP